MTRKCTLCGKRKPPAAFQSGKYSRCTDCVQQLLAATCHICGAPTGVDGWLRPRRFCGPECRKTHRTRTAQARQARRPHRRAFPLLASRPLYEAIQAEFNRCEDISIEDFCAGLGITARSFTAWRSGERPLVQFNVADTVIVHLGLLWFDVWEAGTPEGAVAAYAFEGVTEPVAA